MKRFIKPFNKLQVRQWHSLLMLRSEVFVVEQQCVYQDPDWKDVKAVHLWYEKDAVCIAGLRILPPDLHTSVWKIGRVVVKHNQRNQGLGKKLMDDALQYIGNPSEIHISAQAYLQKFYEKLSFVTHGSTYLEDGIPHLHMIRMVN